MSPHWTETEYQACEQAKDFKDLLLVALKVLERMNQLGQPIVEVCGPMSTGGRGSREENMKFYGHAVRKLEGVGETVFNPMPFQETMLRLSSHLKNGEYNMDILEVFYRGVFSSGHIKKAYFLPDWQSSKGATWERQTVADLGIQIEEYPVELLGDF